MATELNYPSNPIDGYVVLDNLILPPETFAALRALAISKAQSPEAMARQLDRPPLKPDTG
ncbi:hypothetical protein [Burkholderia gladioli]|uniref:hypothetical protein n=1 Tax=Burkholderia gladioli TaxID=28095 RepID=UPI001641A269|nr:hypothetical protein [Burkholderia gladioli]